MARFTKIKEIKGKEESHEETYNRRNIPNLKKELEDPKCKIIKIIFSSVYFNVPEIEPFISALKKNHSVKEVTFDNKCTLVPEIFDCFKEVPNIEFIDLSKKIMYVKKTEPEESQKKSSTTNYSLAFQPRVHFPQINQIEDLLAEAEKMESEPKSTLSTNSWKNSSTVRRNLWLFKHEMYNVFDPDRTEIPQNTENKKWYQTIK